MIPQLLIHPDILNRESRAEKLLADINLTRQHHSLLWFSPEEKLGIEQARQIKEFLSLKPYQGGKQAVVLITSENLTPEAQNALLKTLEEPPGEALIILGVSSEDQLLPTILSRCHISYLANTTDQDKQLTEKEIKDIEKLLSSSIEQRFVFVEKLKDRDEFLLTLTAYFRHKLLEISSGGATSPPGKWTHDFLKELIQAQRWDKQNVNIRAILEYLMLKMPRIDDR